MSSSLLPLLRPDWAAPATVHAVVTTRQGGVSVAPYDALNLAYHVGDDPAAVSENRWRLQQALQAVAPCELPQWLEQVHGKTVIKAGSDTERREHWVPAADAVWTDQPEVPVAVMTADCLPVLFCDRAGRHVAAAHAGWRGLDAGVLEATIVALPVPSSELLAWIGPAIGPDAFEVGPEVRDAFLAHDPSADACFRPSHRPDHFLADLPGLARRRLQTAGLTDISGGAQCTVQDAQRFYSYRRDGRTGRFATLIWMSS